MKGTLFFILFLIILTGCMSSGQPEEMSELIPVDTMTAASGKYYYEAGSYGLESLKDELASYPYSASTAVSSVNPDGSPNLAVTIPGFSECGQYLVLGLAENRTRENIMKDGRAVIIFYDYKPMAAREERHKGCRVLVKWVGQEADEWLNIRDEREKPGIYLEIVEILPLG